MFQSILNVVNNRWANLLMLCLVEVYGDFKFKAYARSSANTSESEITKLFIQGCVGYMGVIYFLIRMLRTKDVIWVNPMWDGGSALIETLFAYFMYGERLNHCVNYLGLVLIVLGIFMLRTG
jgi:multidrug transporter EmrE-like cation transporter